MSNITCFKHCDKHDCKYHYFKQYGNFNCRMCEKEQNTPRELEYRYLEIRDHRENITEADMPYMPPSPMVATFPLDIDVAYKIGDHAVYDDFNDKIINITINDNLSITINSVIFNE